MTSAVAAWFNLKKDTSIFIAEASSWLAEPRNTFKEVFENAMSSKISFL